MANGSGILAGLGGGARAFRKALELKQALALQQQEQEQRQGDILRRIQEEMRLRGELEAQGDQRRTAADVEEENRQLERMIEIERGRASTLPSPFALPEQTGGAQELGQLQELLALNAELRREDPAREAAELERIRAQTQASLASASAARALAADRMTPEEPKETGPTRSQIGREIVQARDEGETAALQDLINRALVEEKAQSRRLTPREWVFGAEPVGPDDISIDLGFKFNQARTVEGRAFWLGKHPEWEAIIRQAGVEAMNQRMVDLGAISPEQAGVQLEDPGMTPPPDVEAMIQGSPDPEAVRAIVLSYAPDWDLAKRAIENARAAAGR